MYSAGMNLLPEQVKAREYLDQQGSRRSAGQIAERVVASFTAIEEFLDDVSETEARAHGIRGEWSIKEVVIPLAATPEPRTANLPDPPPTKSPPTVPFPPPSSLPIPPLGPGRICGLLSSGCRRRQPRCSATRPIGR